MKLVSHVFGGMVVSGMAISRMAISRMAISRMAINRIVITKNHAENQFRVQDWLKVPKSVKNSSVGRINVVFFGDFSFRALTPWKKEEMV